MAVQSTALIEVGEMRYQLVIQVPATSIEDYDEVVALEDVIATELGITGEVDGHDANSKRMNIFIHTDDPQAAFAKIRSSIESSSFAHEYKIAFRAFGEDDFTILHPRHLCYFAI